VVAGAAVAASAVVVAGDEEAAVAAVGAVAEAGTVTAGTAAAAETAAGNRAVQLRNLNLEPGRPPWRSPLFYFVCAPLSRGTYLWPLYNARIVTHNFYN